jgi:hypothetical protein
MLLPTCTGLVIALTDLSGVQEMHSVVDLHMPAEELVSACIVVRGRIRARVSVCMSVCMSIHSGQSRARLFCVQMRMLMLMCMHSLIFELMLICRHMYRYKCVRAYAHAAP